MKYIVIGIIYWIISTILAAGIQHAHYRAEFSLGYHHCRDDIGFSILWGAFPFALPVIIGLTGGAQDGWNLDCKGVKK